MAAASAPRGLRYVSDEEPGFTRRRNGTGFVYLDRRGRPLKNPRHLARIRALAIPPAWTDVWISPDRRGHLQATGRDAKGRKQYRYHDRWREHRDRAKFDRMAAFGSRLPDIRKRIAADLRRKGLPRERVLAAVTRLLDLTLMRVGNDEYARDNGSYGLTTLRERHANVRGSTIRFRFRGKSGKEHEVDLEDPRVARIVKRCQDLPGQRLFRYVDEDGQPRDVSSEDVNEYIREAAGEDFSAKDFRTWTGTVLAACALAAAGPATSERHARRVITQAIKDVAAVLANTPAVCRASYVHPAVLDAYLSDGLPEDLQAAGPVAMERLQNLRRAERHVLRFLARAQDEAPAAA